MLGTWDYAELCPKSGIMLFYAKSIEYAFSGCGIYPTTQSSGRWSRGRGCCPAEAGVHRSAGRSKGARENRVGKACGVGGRGRTQLDPLSDAYLSLKTAAQPIVSAHRPNPFSLPVPSGLLATTRLVQLRRAASGQFLKSG